MAGETFTGHSLFHRLIVGVSAGLPRAWRVPRLVAHAVAGYAALLWPVTATRRRAAFVSPLAWA